MHLPVCANGAAHLHRQLKIVLLPSEEFFHKHFVMLCCPLNRHTYRHCVMSCAIFTKSFNRSRSRKRKWFQALCTRWLWKAALCRTNQHTLSKHWRLMRKEKYCSLGAGPERNCCLRRWSVPECFHIVSMTLNRCSLVRRW